MGFYINDLPDGTPLPKIGKAEALIDAGLAVKTVMPATFDSIPVDKAVIAVIDNRLFDAAAYMDETIYTSIKREQRQSHARNFTFLSMNREMAMKMSGLWEYLEMVSYPRED